MAEKRMFAKTIIDSDAFLDMPLSTQALYFHLSMRADDDGFINNPKRIVRMINANDDDLRVLITKRFVLVFDSGVIVIKHWRLHNTLRKDRYKPTIYQEEFKQLSLKKDGGYTDRLPSGCQMVTKQLPNGNQEDAVSESDEKDESKEINGLDYGCQSGNQVATQNRIDKNRLDKNTNKQLTHTEAIEVSETGDVGFESSVSDLADDMANEETQKVIDDSEAVVNPVQVIGLARMHGIKVYRSDRLNAICSRNVLTVDNIRQCIRIAKKENKGGSYLIGILSNAVNEPNEYHTWEYLDQKHKAEEAAIDWDKPFE